MQTGGLLDGYMNFGGCNDFEHGSIYCQGGNAFTVYGTMKEKWINLGGEKGFLGFPTSDELGTPDGIGRYNYFQAGLIYWTPDTGAHEVHGDIAGKWDSLGRERSYLGYPVTDECETPDTIGRYNHFQGGSIYWTPDTGAQAIHRLVFEKWESLGWEQGYLGYPLTDTEGTPTTVLSNDFQGGFIRSGQ
jgi:uncharacterized protein with LGFP repeats